MSETSIKNWSPAERPREKLLQAGASVLSEAELIALLIRNGNREKSAVELARCLLKDFNHDLQELARADFSSISRQKGIGQVKAISLLAAMELGRRIRLSSARKVPKVAGSKDAVQLLQPVLSDLDHEEFWVMLLNRANALIDMKPISKGGISGTVADPKLIFREALQGKASGIIVSHNHPSQNPMPSESDIQLTRKLREGGRLLDIAVLDHIIIAGTSFYSFADEGTL